MILNNDFQRQWADLGADVLAAVDRVGKSGWYVLGQEVRGFERELAKLWGLREAVGVANGMDAIEIGLRALGCRPGDRVLTTPLSAFATTLAIVRLGAIPVFIDTDEHGLIDLVRCHDLLRHRVRAINEAFAEAIKSAIELMPASFAAITMLDACTKPTAGTKSFTAS